MSGPEYIAQSGSETSKEIDIRRRRALAIQATEAARDVLGTSVTIPGLIEKADSPKSSNERLLAKRALRAIAGVAEEDSPIVAAVGQDGVFDYMEGVITYGASDKTYLDLIDKLQITAEEATGLYGLRELIAEHTNGVKPGFQLIINALVKVGISIPEAARDPDLAMAAFDEHGFFTDHLTYEGKQRPIVKQLDRAAFVPAQGLPPVQLIEGDTDGSRTTESLEVQRETLRKHPEESDDEAWHPTDIADFLRNLRF